LEWNVTETVYNLFIIFCLMQVGCEFVHARQDKLKNVNKDKSQKRY